MCAPHCVLHTVCSTMCAPHCGGVARRIGAKTVALNSQTVNPCPRLHSKDDGDARRIEILTSSLPLPPWVRIWMKIFMLQMRMGARVLIWSTHLERLSLCTWWVRSSTLFSTSLVTLLRQGERSFTNCTRSSIESITSATER